MPQPLFAVVVLQLASVLGGRCPASDGKLSVSDKSDCLFRRAAADVTEPSPERGCLELVNVASACRFSHFAFRVVLKPRDARVETMAQCEMSSHRARLFEGPASGGPETVSVESRNGTAEYLVLYLILGRWNSSRSRVLLVGRSYSAST